MYMAMYMYMYMYIYHTPPCVAPEPYLEECKVLVGATFATVGYNQCGSDLVTFVDCALRSVATVPKIGSGDLLSTDTSGAWWHGGRGEGQWGGWVHL
jgi:hypothetical protein